MSLHDEFGYEVDISLKKVKGKVAKPLQVKLLKKGSGTKGVKLVKKKSVKNKPSSIGSQYKKRTLAIGGGGRP